MKHDFNKDNRPNVKADCCEASCNFILLSSIMEDDTASQSATNPELVVDADAVEIVTEDAVEEEVGEEEVEEVIEDPFHSFLNKISSKLNQYFYLDDDVPVKKEMNWKPSRPFKKSSSKEKTASSVKDKLTQEIIAGNTAALEQFIAQNDIEKLKYLFSNNAKLVKWVKDSDCINKLPLEIWQIIDAQ